MSDTKDKLGRSHWYLRRGEVVSGPFPAAQVGRYALLGRVCPQDEVSADGAVWVPIGERPELIPAPLRQGADEQTLLRLRLREDERTGIDRRAGQVPPPGVAERRSGEERRRPEPPEVVRWRERRWAALQDMRRGAARSTSVWLGLAAVSLLVVVGALLLSPTPPARSGRCNAPPGAGVDWHGCRLDRLDLSGVDLSGARLRDARAAGVRLTRARLSGADLAYADLAGAGLGQADLVGATLTGTNLRGADLTGADLGGADLSYADLYQARLGDALLAGARLDRAVWVDGRVCGPGSVGACLGP